MARIAIDPELWRKVRTRAFETGTTGAAIVNEALEAYLAKPPAKSSDGAPRSANPPREAGIGGIIEGSHMEGGERVIDEVRLMEVSVTKEQMPWDGPKIISTPEEAAKVAAEIPAIHPVPKPSAARKPRR